MAKRILLSIVCWFVLVSFVHAQCNKRYEASINGNNTLSSEFNGQQSVVLNLCKGYKATFRLNNLDADVLRIRWYKNDSLIATTTEIETSITGIYRIELETEKCLYKIGNINADFSDNLQVSLVEEEIVVCENGSSNFYLHGNVITSMTDIRYQWQKDGKDIQGMTKSSLTVSTPGSYALRATAGTCSSTSQPTIARGRKDNLLTNLISYPNGNPIKKDTIFICKDYTNILRNPLYSEWYLNGKYVSTGYEITPTASGIYTTSYSFGNNCFSKSKPLYISLDTKISPIEPDFLAVSNDCDTKYIQMINSNLKTPNILRFYDFTSNNLVTSYSTPNNYFYESIPNGKYKVELETGSCKSIPSYWDLTKNVLPLRLHITGQNIGGKKINLCGNNYLDISVQFSTSDEVSLYKNGLLVEKRPSFKSGAPTYFRVLSSGKYHITTFNTLCPERGEIFSDTIEVILAEPISTKLTTSCESDILTVQKHEGYSYYWYKNDAIIPNETNSTLKLNNKSGTYYAVLQKDLCSVATQPITIEEKIKASALSICEGNSFSLEAGLKNASYLWKGPNNFTSDLSTIVIKNALRLNAGWYRLQVTKNGCIFSDSVEIKVNQKPDLSLRIISPMCINKNIVVEIKGQPGSYKVEYNYGLGNLSRNLEIVSADKEQYYNLWKLQTPFEGVKEYMQINLNTCVLPIDIPPRLTQEECKDVLEFSNVKQSYCEKEVVSLKFNIPKNIPTETKFTLRMESSRKQFNLGTIFENKKEFQFPENSDGYWNFILESTDKKYKIISTDFYVSDLTPIISAKISDHYSSFFASHCDGYSTTITSYTFDAATTYQWKKDGVNIVGANASTFDAKESGMYSLEVNTYNGCKLESPEVHITSGEIFRPEITSQMGNNIACTGSIVPIIESSGFAYTNYIWKHQGNTIKESTKNVTFEAPKSGYYSLIAKQGTCEAHSDSIWVEMSQSLPNHITAFNRTGQIKDTKVLVCDNSIVSFRSEDNYGNTEIMKKYGFSFQWKMNNNNIPGANESSFSAAKSGIYHLQIKQGDCIVNSNKFEIANQNASGIKLVTSSYSNSTHKKDTLLFCKGDASITYFQSGAGEMSGWNKELYKDGMIVEKRGWDNNTQWNNSFSLKEEGKYYLKISSPEQNTCIALSDTINIKFATQPIILETDTSFYCNKTAYFYAPQGGQSYQWMYKDKVISDQYSIKVQEAGLYEFEVKKDNTCTITGSFFLEKKLKPLLRYSWNDPIVPSLTLCEGEKIELFIWDNNYVSEVPDSNFVFEWYNSQQKLPETNSTLTINKAGNYYSKVRYKECESISNMLKIEMPNIEKQISPLKDSLGICPKDGFQMLEAFKDSDYTYEWFKDNASLEQTTSTIKANQQGVYRALIQSGKCSALTRKIKIYSNVPTATISGDTTLIAGNTANLKLSFTASPPFSYTLNNNETGVSEKNNIIHPVKVNEGNIFRLTSVSNNCGEGSVSGEAKIQIIILANEPLIGHKITLAPVPAESYCEMTFDLPTSQEVSYQLLDISGRQLSEKNLGNITYKKQYLNLNQLSAGEYLIRIQVGKDIVTRKLIKY